MSTGYTRLPIPADVERALRQESGFGCARCGHPYIEYHHIIPYAEEKHFRPADMVALCGNCYPALSKLPREYQYEIKSSPHNIKNMRFYGALEYSKDTLVFKVGGNWYENTPIILQHFNTPIISCKLENGQAKVSLNLLDKDNQHVLSVVDNEIMFRIDDFWDFEYNHNFAIARYGSRNIALRMDFRNQDATIEGKLWLNGKQVTLGKNETNIESRVKLIGNRIINATVGIQVGDPTKNAGGGILIA